MCPHVSLYLAFLACIFVSLTLICSAIWDLQFPVTLPQHWFAGVSVCCCFIHTWPLSWVCSVSARRLWVTLVYAVSAIWSTIMFACSWGVYSSHILPGVYTPLCVLPSVACPFTHLSVTLFPQVCFSLMIASHTSLSLCFVQYGPRSLSMEA